MTARNPVICKWLILLFSIVQGYFCQAQLKADFTANATSGCSPIIVKFSDASAGNPTAWKWDLGNGTISYLRNPSVTYFASGRYNVKLFISSSTGKDSVIKLQYITVYAKPVTNFSASETTGCFPLPVQFTDLSTPGSGALTKWEWDFGDGITASGATQQHIYKAAGNFNVSLRVTNSYGCTQSITKPKYIQINTGVLAGFDIKSSNTCKAPATISFANTSTGNGSISYQWDFGDGIGSTLVNPSHLYITDGSYTVKLVVKNSTGCTDTLISINAIILGNTNAGFSAPAKTCQGNFADIINTSTPLTAGVLWDFGDGSTSTDTFPVKQYSSPGNYIIKMIADFGACLDSLSKPITVLPKPLINFTADETIDCKVPFAVHFIQNVIGGTTYSWDFGDGTSSAEANPTHTYSIAGNHTVRLIAFNITGCSDTLIKPGFIQIQLPELSIPDLPVTGCAPFTYNFTSKVVASEPIASYKWSFGDGAVSSETSPTHTFTQTGSYRITEIITTSGGCSDTVIVTNGVTVGKRPKALFSANPRNACAKVPISFTDLSTGKVDEWYWQFGDGGTSIEQNPVHIYGDTGSFTVTLVAINNGCTDTLIINKYIHINPPVAKFFVKYDCALPLQRIFTDNSVGADTWLWDFGDGDTSSVVNPVHDYKAAGKYLVNLTVTNFSTGCSFIKPQTITVIDEKANFNASDSVVCKGTLINFTTASMNPVNITSYAWNFGDNTSITSSSGVIAHVYKLAGNYSVTLVITDLLGCSDTLIKSLYIQVDGPTALFEPSIPGTCLNNAITFNDNSFSDGTHNIQQWIWSYGDGIEQILTAPPFSHTYSTAGIFTVKLKLIDSKGCADSIVKPDALLISQPLAGFKTNDTISCPQKPVTFVNISTGPDLTFLWNFGDGSTSSEINPVHQYSSEGVFSLRLFITDKYGCTDYILKDKFVKIVIPQANFTMSDSISTCPPLVVNFTNTSLNAITSLWDFGDGNTSLEKDPSHFYAFPGEYNVILKITSAGNCISEKTKQIIIKGPSGNFSYTNITGCVPLTTNFKASTKNSAYIIWDFNDGTTVNTSDTILTHKYVNPGIYLPKIIIVDSAGCQVPIVGTDTIIVYGVKADFDMSPVVLCDSGSVIFTDKSISNDLITSYSWSFGDGAISIQQHPVHTYIKSGLYDSRLMITTQSGCIDSLSIREHVKVVNSPKIAITGKAGTCIPAIINFSGNILAADTSALSWLWNFGNGNSSTLQSPPSQIYLAANLYTIQLAATNSSGCVAIVNKSVNTYPLPDVKIFADSTVCSGNTVNLSATGAASYSWAPSKNLSCTTCANPVAKPDSSALYAVKGTSAYGCIASDSILVTVKFPITIQVNRGDTLCIGTSTLLSASGGEKYVWSPSAGLNNPSVSSPVATPLQTTNYRVIATDSKGCYKDTGYVAVKVYPIPTVDAGDDQTINVGKTVELVPVVSSDVTDINWSPTSGIFRNSYPGITVKPTESLEYTVEVNNTGGCLARDRVTVNVLCDKANVYIPNTFSPNGDGANDIFYPRGSGLFQIKVLKVFNRWGEIVFEKSSFNANDISSGWNGIFKGQKLLPDVFVYIMDVVCDNNTILTFKGNVALVL